MLLLWCFIFFFFNDTATTEIYTLSLHDALPIFDPAARTVLHGVLALLEEVVRGEQRREPGVEAPADELVEHRPLPLGAALLAELVDREHRDREERAEDVHVPAVRIEAGADVGEEQHELDVAGGDALLEREV